MIIRMFLGKFMGEVLPKTFLMMFDPLIQMGLPILFTDIYVKLLNLDILKLILIEQKLFMRFWNQPIIKYVL
jgi:hypothetical protein